MRQTLDRDVCIRAVNERDPRFDGAFFVAIKTTGIYCRPVCPSRRARDENRIFFDTAASAERAGYRPCLRCRPELAPGSAPTDAVSNLVREAVQRIRAGELNGRRVEELAYSLGVSERHLRRVMRKVLGVSPAQLAQEHRLRLARRLVADTRLPVTRIAYASGFQSLRRFSDAFRKEYGVTPRALRRNAEAEQGQESASTG